MEQEFLREKEWLAEVLEHLKTYSKRIGKQLRDTETYISESLKMYNKDNIDAIAEVLYQTQLLSSLQLKTKVSKSSLKKPYFSRVDFKGDNESGYSKYYLGKMSVFSDRDAPLVIDWRAPVASLYYDGRIGEAAYDCPDGLISGEIGLKRQYFIENAELSSFIDIDITANDEFLQAALGSSKDKRLKDIVSTIQAEQNRIIRADMHGPVIVQGAAGSGKTTIALHRIAYLLYTYEKRLSPEHVMVIAPNRYFLSYISDVLPDLGVENVRQTTFEDFVFDFIEQSVPLITAEEKLSHIINQPDQKAVAETAGIKSSLAYKDVIEKYTEKIIENLLPKKDFSLGEYRLLGYEYIQKLLCREYAFLPVNKRINEVRKYLSGALKKRKPEFIAAVINRTDELEARIKNQTSENSSARREALTKLYDARDAKIKDINKKASGLVSRYLNGIKLKPALAYYIELLRNRQTFVSCCENILEPVSMELVWKHSSAISGGRNIKIETEDLAPLLLLHMAFYGNEGFDIRHIVIDEAQDMSLFRAYALRKLLNTGSFTILGDLCQGIYSFMGVKRWEDVSEQIFGNKDIRYMQLEQSYRTTVEIMDFANKAAKRLNLKGIPLAKPVIRHGNEVRVRIKTSLEEAASDIDGLIAGFSKQYQSIAVICKTAGECARFKSLLKTPISMLTGKENDFSGGIVILPAHLSKGLEFDCVIIANAGKNVYGTSELEIKMLYVAMTRALHEMAVFSVGEVSGIIS